MQYLHGLFYLFCVAFPSVFITLFICLFYKAWSVHVGLGTPYVDKAGHELTEIVSLSPKRNTIAMPCGSFFSFSSS